MTHPFKPHQKHPWFCDECGYPPNEALMHGADDRSDAASHANDELLKAARGLLEVFGRAPYTSDPIQGLAEAIAMDVLEAAIAKTRPTSNSDPIQ